jgi:hypothetical protein
MTRARTTEGPWCFIPISKRDGGFNVFALDQEPEALMLECSRDDSEFCVECSDPIRHQ